MRSRLNEGHVQFNYRRGCKNLSLKTFRQPSVQLIIEFSRLISRTEWDSQQVLSLQKKNLCNSNLETYLK